MDMILQFLNLLTFSLSISEIVYFTKILIIHLIDRVRNYRDFTALVHKCKKTNTFIVMYQLIAVK